MKQIEKARIATVRATGERFLVEQIDFSAGKVFLYGEIVQVAEAPNGGCNIKYDRIRVSPLDDIDLSKEIPRTFVLCVELFREGVKRAQERGEDIKIRTKRIVRT